MSSGSWLSVELEKDICVTDAWIPIGRPDATRSHGAIFDGNNHDWEKESNVIINKKPFVAIDPIIGCDYCISESIHITVKFDYLFGFNNKDLYLPTGPRAYIGFIFFH